MPSAVALAMPGRALGHEQQHAVVGGGEMREVQAGVAGVVDARHRRLVAVHHDVAQRLEARPSCPSSVQPRNALFSGKYGKSLTVTSVMKHRAPSLPMTTWRMSGPAARRGTFLMRVTRAVGEDRLEADDHVLDAAVQRGELADAARRHEAAQVGHGLGLRRVAGGQAQLAHAVFERLQRHAALAGGLHVVGVDVDDLGSWPSRR